jgi:16S rRNA G966 N2-methylase RsmD
VKQRAAKQYITTAWERTDEGDLIRPETNKEVAEKLGVGKSTVARVFDSSAKGPTLEVVKNSQVGVIYHDRVKAREYYEDNPDASYREVARQVETSRPKVTEWLKEDFDEGDDDDDADDDDEASLAAFARDESEAEKAAETFEKATDADTDDEVRETAEQKTEEIITGQTTPDDAAKDLEKTEERIEDKRRREEQREAFDEAVESNDAVEIHHGDFNEVLRNFDENSFDHIITDPPYHERHLHLYGELAEVAERVVKPGGLVAAIAPHNFLPSVIDEMSPHLDWFWQWVMIQDEPTILAKKKVGIRYKPIVVFHVPPETALDKQAHDIITPYDREKDEHKWQQPVRTTAELITDLTEPNDRICDPMAGSGTTGIAALDEERRAVLIDNDEDALTTARERLSEVIDDD